MKIAITGHTSGIGKSLFDYYESVPWPREDIVIGFSRSNGYNINNPQKIIEQSLDSDVFINNAYDGFNQVSLLYELINNGYEGKVINISSTSSDGIKNQIHPYAISKYALDKASEQLFYRGFNVTNLRLGWVDTPRVSEKAKNKNKMSTNYVVDVIEWVLNQPHRIKEMTICPYPHNSHRS